MFTIDDIRSYIYDHRTVIAAVCAGAAAVLVLCIVLAVVLPAKNRRMQDSLPPVPDRGTVFSFSEIILPPEPGAVSGFILSRDRTYQWSADDVSRWFTIPDDELLDQLETKNDELVRNILEAAP